MNSAKTSAWRRNRFSSPVRSVAARLVFPLCLFLVIAFAAAMPTAPALALSSREEARISAMLTALEHNAELVFIRNDSEHSAAEAASHLRLKLSKIRGRLESAEQFIDKAASSSSLTGQPYLVREPGKTAIPANTFLHDLLKRTAPQ